MLNSIYNRILSMTIANGYSYDWEISRSIGNGAEALHDMVRPVANVTFGEDENSEILSHGTYWLETQLFITAMIDFNMTGIDLDKIDQKIEESKIALKKDLRKAFFRISPEMSTVKIEATEYVRSVKIESQGHIAAVKTEFKLQYTEEV